MTHRLAPGKIVLLLLTHLFGLPLFFIPAYFRVPSLATLAACELAGSFTWHVQHAGLGASWWEDYVPLQQAQVLDHSMNILYISWLVTYVYAMAMELRLTYMFINIFFVLLMAHNLVSTPVMYLYLGVSILTIIGFRLLLPRKQYPLARLDAFLFIFAFVIAAPGVIFYAWSTSVFDKNYWWSHSIWHFFVYNGGTIINLVIFEFHIATMLGLKPLISRAKLAILEHIRVTRPTATLADVNDFIRQHDNNEASAAKALDIDVAELWRRPPSMALALAGDAVVVPNRRKRS